MYAYVENEGQYEIHIRELYKTDLPSLVMKVDNEKLAMNITQNLCISYDLGYENGCHEADTMEVDD